VTKPEAKRLACRIGAGLLERWLQSDWAPGDDVPPEANARVEKAAQELADELRRRSARLTYPAWWGGPQV